MRKRFVQRHNRCLQTPRFLSHAIVIATVTTLVVSLSNFAAAQNSQPAELPAGAASAQSGMATSTQAAAVVEMSAIPQITAATAAAGRAAPPPRSGVSEAVYRARKAAAAATTPMFGGEVGGAPAAAPLDFTGSIGIETPGASKSFAGLDETCAGVIPSDHALAVSPTFVVQIINSCITVLNKTTGATQLGFPKGLRAFFTLAPATAFLGDPRALYDQKFNRFVLLAEDFNTGLMYVNISKTNSPLGAWWQYVLSIPTAVATDFPDFPTLSVDRNILYLGATVFHPNNTFTSVMGFYPRAKMYAGQAIGAFTFGFNFNVGGVEVDTLQPALTYTDFPRAGFMVDSFNINFGGGQCVTGCNGLVVWAVSNALVVAGTPGVEISGVIVPTANTYFFPPNALQSGCASPTALCALDTGDTRISGQVTFDSGTLWGSLNTKRSGNNTATVLWFQLRPYLNDNDARCTGAFLNKCPQITGVDILNEDCYFCGGRGNSGSDFFGTVVPDAEGNATMVANYSDLSFHPGVFYVSRRVTQAKNTMHDAGVFLATGQTFYQQLDQFNRNRWGDYTAAEVDSANAFWFAGQYSGPGGIWSTRIGKNAFTAINQP
jgi:hypothetical protein